MPVDQQSNRYKDTLTILYSITKLVNDGVALNDLLSHICKAAISMSKGNTCSVMLFDQDKKELLCKASYGLSTREEKEIAFKYGEGVAGWVAQNSTSAIIDDVSEDSRFKVINYQQAVIRSMLCVPLIIGFEVIGVLTVTSDQSRMFTREDEELINFLSSSIIKDIENARLFRLAITDNLTKAYNRQFMHQRLPEEIERSKRYRENLSIALIDIDHFKNVNDLHGHQAGDAILKRLSLLILDNIRDVDFLIRYGGEEFLIIFPNTSLQGAMTITERIRNLVEKFAFQWLEKKINITISAGLAAIHSHVADSESLIHAADQALYRAKENGRNSVEG
jgi:diguanylate cyclase (GGDEF)-like protein